MAASPSLASIIGTVTAATRYCYVALLAGSSTGTQPRPARRRTATRARRASTRPRSPRHRPPGIDVGFHYQRNCDLDRRPRGRLTNFSGWTAVADTGLDAAITAAAAAQGQQVNGNIVDRDTAQFDNGRYSVHEVQYRKGDFGS